MRLLAALAAGALFGLGLIVSDMVNPARVLGFLDIAGDWDPTLAFVLAGALAPMAVVWRIAAGRAAPVCGGSFPGRPSTRLDGRLIGGAALFGVGWGLVGFCPGPALVALGSGSLEALTFSVAMLIGMLVYEFAAPAEKAA
ncbi:MAG TPA: DUF6691 family protein [Thermohalobaculum sp.]|nr:DUF6691 family protein [Thermohalobaculum sp.]